MKRVLHISKYYYPFNGGTEQVARDCVQALLSTDVEQKVICFNETVADGKDVYKSNETVHEMVDGIEVIRCSYAVKFASQSLSFSYSYELKQVMNEFQPDIVILHYPNPFVSQLLLKYTKRDFRLVLYWHLDITKQKVLGKLFHHQNIQLLERADYVIATSPYYVEGSSYLQAYRNKCVIIPNSINVARFTVTDAIQEKAAEIRAKYDGKTICFAVGRHVPYKGMVWLVRASKYLSNGFAVLIGGTGPLTESIKEEAKLDSKVEFLGRVCDEDLVAYYLAADVFCFPSITKNEAFGIALAEGMYFGKPAVTFTIPGSGVNYVNLDGITGIECPNCDAKAYAKALEKLRSDYGLRKMYGDAARERVLNHFTTKQFMKSLIELIKAL